MFLTISSLFIAEQAAHDGAGAGTHDGAERVIRGALGDGLAAGLLAAEDGVDKIRADRARNGGRRVRDGALHGLAALLGFLLRLALRRGLGLLLRLLGCGLLAEPRLFGGRLFLLALLFGGGFVLPALLLRRGLLGLLTAALLQLGVRLLKYLICGLAVDAVAVFQLKLVREDELAAFSRCRQAP